MRNEKIAFLLSLPITAVFVLCLLLTVLTGARVYRKTVRKTEEDFAMRTKTQYLSTKILESREVAVEDFDGKRALALPETADGECYVTYIYCHGGWLRELYCPEAAALSPEDGEKVLEAEQLEVSLEEGLLCAVIDGQQIFLSVR